MMEIEKITVEEFKEEFHGHGRRPSAELKALREMAVGSAIRLTHPSSLCDTGHGKCSLTSVAHSAKSNGQGVWHITHEAPHVALVYREA